MIGKLRGTVDAIGESLLILDVNGVGYEVQASLRALRGLKVGEEASLTIDTHVRDDAIRLYGFASEVERTWFRTLQNVQGVGAKVALAVLGVLSPQDLATAVALGNWAELERAPGVGKKLAQRIVMELKDKAPKLPVAGLKGSGPGSAAVAVEAVGTGNIENNATAEAISALTNLGYAPAQAAQAVAIAFQEFGSEADTAQLIRRGLRELAR